MIRREARELALKALFQIDISGCEPGKAIPFVLGESGYEGDDKGSEEGGYMEGLTKGVHAGLKEIDGLLGKFAVGWNVERMGTVDRNILRIALYELAMAEPKVPVGVALNEAVELAKLYGDDESPRFINGVLANVVKGLQVTGRI